ncbi:MAG: glycosyltransferase family A protein [Thermodesulfobacteriota bacterium]
MKSDVTALVLTIGEKTLNKSIESLKKQSLRPEDIIIVKNVVPFHKAINKGISMVKSEYFIQCDADMVLGPDCIEVMRSFMKNKTGVAIGYLEDALLGTIQAIKMFRTECVKNTPFPDSITTDSDRISHIRKEGYRIVFARRKSRKYNHSPDVLGKHCPDYYNPSYVFRKFSLMGSKVRNRHSYDEFKACLAALKKSKHPMADTALVAFCHGIFFTRKKCGHKPFKDTKEFKILQEFEKERNSENRIFAITKIKGFNPMSS